MADRNIIEIRISGDNVNPDTVSASDAADIILNTEIMIAALIARDNPALGLDISEVLIGLTAINHGSYGVMFQSPHEQEFITATHLAAEAITTGNYGRMPSKSINAIKVIRKKSRKYSTDIQFWEHNGQVTQLATVNTNTKIDTEVPTFKSHTTLYGNLTSVGGASQPRASLRLFSGNILRCNVSVLHGIGLAKQLGQRLYTDVGVEGEATYDLRDMSIENFLIQRLTEYSKTPITEALDSLNVIMGKYLEDIDDIDSFVADLRGKNEDVEWQ
jgi:hypothetical protein